MLTEKVSITSPLVYKTPARELLDGVSIKEIASTQPLLFVQENDTVTKIIDNLAENKTSFAVVLREDSPIGIVDVQDIVSYCNKKIRSKSTSNMFEVVEQLDQLKLELTQAILKEIIPQDSWYSRPVASSKSVLQLIHILCKLPTLKKVPIVENGRVIAVCSKEDVLDFILINDKMFSDELQQTIGQINFHQCSSSVASSTNEDIMNYAFKIMWEKQINGALASCNRSSAIDLFFNWLHYVHSAASLLSHEPGVVLKTASLETAAEQMLRENLHYLYVIETQPRGHYKHRSKKKQCGF